MGSYGQKNSVLPGFGPTLGYTVFYLSVVVLIPLSALFFKTATLSWDQFLVAVAAPRVVASYRVTFGSAFAAAGVNAVFGVLVAWVLVRYRFPGRKLVDALVDLPFALPTAVAGITLASVYSPNGWLGGLLEPLGIKVAFTQLGILVAMIFIGLPFVVRTVQPVLEDLDQEIEEAASCLGANRWQTFCCHADWICPCLRPRGGGVRLCHLYCGQHADGVGDYPAAHNHQAGAVRLCRGDRHRNSHA